jgi:hypothetical protein
MGAQDMTQESAKLISIWTWVGIVLLAYGLIITGTGIYYAFTGAPATVLGNLNPSLWWGAIMVLAGVVLLFLGRRAT